MSSPHPKNIYSNQMIINSAQIEDGKWNWHWYKTITWQKAPTNISIFFSTCSKLEYGFLYVIKFPYITWGNSFDMEMYLTKYILKKGHES